MSAPKKSSKSGTGIVGNMKKGLLELLVLYFLNEKPMSIYEIIKLIQEKSNGACSITYPYAVIYRLQKGGYIDDAGKMVLDDRMRFSYKITATGKARLKAMLAEYHSFMGGIDAILSGK